MSDKKTHNVVPKDVKVGDIMTFTYYVKVEANQKSGDVLIVEDLDRPGKKIKIEGKELVGVSKSADQFHETVQVTKTAAAEHLVQAFGVPLSVAFIKADGTERIMRCRLIRPEPLLGRSMVEDFEADIKNRIRQVDHRTIEWLIIEGVKYVVK